MSDDSTKQHLFALMAHAEEQQKNIDQALDIINKQQAQIESLHKQLPHLAQQLFTDSLRDARTSIESDLNNHATKAAQDLRKVSKEAMQAAQSIREETRTLDWKHAFMTVGAILGVCVLVILSASLLVPSFDDISERKATVKELNNAGGGFQTATCNGDLCVRVMTKQCGFGDSKDYCVLDLK